MSKIGILGGRDSVLGFLSIGFVAMPVKDEHEARRALHKLAAEDCAVIFVTEEYAAPNRGMNHDHAMELNAIAEQISQLAPGAAQFHPKES